ncbi:MAG: hypothetical protein NTW96_27670 [Planctomycetia bacterium]|nr:hypothetical protein [Planctomycetia bacterium]
MEAPAPKRPASVVVRLNDPADVAEFFLALKKASDLAKQSGAIHSAFAHQKDGSVFQVELQYPTRHA